MNKKAILFIFSLLFLNISYSKEEVERFDSGGLQAGDVITSTPSTVIRLGANTPQMLALKSKIESLTSNQNTSVTCESLNRSKRRLREEFEAAVNELERRLHAADPKSGAPSTFVLESIRNNPDEEGVCGIVFGYSSNTKRNSRVLSEYDIEGNTLEIIQYATGL